MLPGEKSKKGISLDAPTRSPGTGDEVRLKLCQVPEEVTSIYPLAVYTKEAAHIVKLGIQEFREKVKAGEIRARVRGSRLLFLVSDLQEYLEQTPDYRPGDSILPQHLREAK